MKLEKFSLADRAVMSLRAMIVGGELAPGKRLIEQEISTDMQVGRGTVRSALAALEAESLVVRQPYSGWAVQGINYAVLVESYQVRGALEELSARLLADTIDSEKEARLNRAYQRLVDVEGAGGPEKRLKADLEFHALIIDECGNTLLASQYAKISGRIEWLYRWSEKNWPNRINLIEWHKPILEAISAGDSKGAAEAVRFHTERSLHDDMQDLISKSPND
jgi:DNA-binding GntR family transcriptional regulator